MGQLYHGDCLEVVQFLHAIGTTVQSVVTDPPYGIDFMGKGWDREVPPVRYWQAAQDEGFNWIGIEKEAEYHAGATQMMKELA